MQHSVKADLGLHCFLRLSVQILRLNTVICLGKLFHYFSTERPFYDLCGFIFCLFFHTLSRKIDECLNRFVISYLT